jgi:hypothetical protein
MKSKVLDRLDQTFDTVLADLYGVSVDKNDSPETWQGDLYNALCSHVDIESKLIGGMKADAEYIDHLRDVVMEQSHIGIFMCSLFKDPTTSSIFKTKLKNLMLAKGFTLQEKGGEMYIKTPKITVGKHN